MGYSIKLTSVWNGARYYTLGVHISDGPAIRQSEMSRKILAEEKAQGKRCIFDSPQIVVALSKGIMICLETYQSSNYYRIIGYTPIKANSPLEPPTIH